MTIRTEQSTDPVGTVRRDRQGRLYVRTDEAPPAYWVVISGPPFRPMWRTPGSLADTEIVGAVPGTPAAEQSNPNAVNPLQVVEVERLRADLDRARAELADLRHNLALRAFTAPDADDETMLASLDSRIADALARSAGARTIPDDAAEWGVRFGPSGILQPLAGEADARAFCAALTLRPAEVVTRPVHDWQPAAPQALAPPTEERHVPSSPSHAHAQTGASCSPTSHLLRPFKLGESAPCHCGAVTAGVEVTDRG